jgi:hypothetical protein
MATTSSSLHLSGAKSKRQVRKGSQKPKARKVQSCSDGVKAFLAELSQQYYSGYEECGETELPCVVCGGNIPEVPEGFTGACHKRCFGEVTPAYRKLLEKHNIPTPSEDELYEKPYDPMSPTYEPTSPSYCPKSE